MTERELKIKENWKPLPSNSDQKLKQIAKDMYDQKLVTDRHCGDMVSSVFMILAFMGPQPPKEPSHPNDNDSVENKRDNALYDLVQRDKDQKKYEEDLEDYKLACKYYEEEYLPSIGLVYEYMTEAGPMAVNGYPTFFSARFLNKEDTKKMFEYYEKYKLIREEADNF